MPNKFYKLWLESMQETGWTDLHEADPAIWQDLGFKCGLEVHQQLKTTHKLFCRCPAGLYHDFDDYDAEILRHMRPTLSELGEYDGTALMEFKTRKNIYYRIKNDSACTYEVDDTPPFPLNREALDHALKIALLLNLNIVGELHITRKQYLDGSIPTGFQRTTILGIEGSFPISNKTIRVIQFSIEEDSCREVSDHGHDRVYYADRLGMPLIETVTYPDMLTPYEAREAAQHIRFIARSSRRVRTGIGAARQDVNVSITGGTRVEIKGVAHISWIPKLTHNEAFRQKSLLLIRDKLLSRCKDHQSWDVSSKMLDPLTYHQFDQLKPYIDKSLKLIAVNLPSFAGILCYFNQVDRCFADEIADRLKVIACLEKPNILHSESISDTPDSFLWQAVKKELGAQDTDAQIIFWATDYDIPTALDTIRERCKMAFLGVPEETRKSLPGGITWFERVLPGADRMYPDTDSAPLSIAQALIDEAAKDLPVSLTERLKQLQEWQIPTDAYTYILRNDLMPVLEELSVKYGYSHRLLALLYAQLLRSLQGRKPLPFDHQRVDDLLHFVRDRGLQNEILVPMLKTLFQHPNMQFSSVLATIGYKKESPEDILAQIPLLIQMWSKVKRPRTRRPDAMYNWIMGSLRPSALGNISLKQLGNELLQQMEAQHA